MTGIPGSSPESYPASSGLQPPSLPRWLPVSGGLFISVGIPGIPGILWDASQA